MLKKPVREKVDSFGDREDEMSNDVAHTEMTTSLVYPATFLGVRE